MFSRRHFIALTAAFGWASRAHAGDATYATAGIAIRGTDPVAYFTQGEAVAGSAEHAVMWQGATWYFVEPHHRAMFEANPWPLAPRYGGYCAHAMSKGRLVPGDPLAWSVASGRLYVMANLEARDMWLAHMDENVARANAYWPAILRG